MARYFIINNKLSKRRPHVVASFDDLKQAKDFIKNTGVSIDKIDKDYTLVDTQVDGDKGEKISAL